MCMFFVLIPPTIRLSLASPAYSMLRSVVRRGLHPGLSESILSARILKENAAPAVIAEFQGVRSYLGWNNLQGFAGQLPTKKNGGEEELLLASRLSGSGGSSALNSGGWNTCGGVCGFGESAALHAQFQVHAWPHFVITISRLQAFLFLKSVNKGKKEELRRRQDSKMAFCLLGEEQLHCWYK